MGIPLPSQKLTRPKSVCASPITCHGASSVCAPPITCLMHHHCALHPSHAMVHHQCALHPSHAMVHHAPRITCHGASSVCAPPITCHGASCSTHHMPWCIISVRSTHHMPWCIMQRFLKYSGHPSGHPGGHMGSQKKRYHVFKASGSALLCFFPFTTSCKAPPLVRHASL